MSPQASNVSPARGFLVFFLVTFLVCSVTNLALKRDSTKLKQQYFPAQARGFLQGRLDLPGEELTAHDLARYHGHVYAIWPPLPAVLMMPAIPFFPHSFPSLTFASLVASFCAGLFYLIFRRVSETWGGPAAMTAALAAGFAWGSSNLVFGICGWHWFIGQATGSAFVLLALWLALDRRVLTRERSTTLAWASWGLSLLARFHLMFGAPLFVFLALADHRYEIPGVGRFWTRFRAALTPKTVARVLVLSSWPAAAIVVMLLFNAARFGNPFDFGLSHHNMGELFVEGYRKYGGWSLEYFPSNFYFTVLRLPFDGRWDRQSWSLGFSLFAQVPLLVLLFARRPTAAPRELIVAAGAGGAAVAFFVLNIMGTGYFQFGARYLHDAMPFLALIVALKRPERYPRTIISLAVLSVIINFWGSLMVLNRSQTSGWCLLLSVAGALTAVALVAAMSRVPDEPAKASG